MQCWELFHKQVLHSESEQYSLSCCRNHAIWLWFLVLFHSNPTNIDQILNWRPTRERALKTASLTYILFCDTIKTRKPNCCLYCTTPIIEHWSGSNPAQNGWFYVWSRLQPCQGTACRVLGQVCNLTGLFLLSEPGRLAGYLDPLVTLSLWQYTEHRSSFLKHLHQHASQVFLQLHQTPALFVVEAFAAAWASVISLPDWLSEMRSPWCCWIAAVTPARAGVDQSRCSKPYSQRSW